MGRCLEAGGKWTSESEGCKEHSEAMAAALALCPDESRDRARMVHGSPGWQFQPNQISVAGPRLDATTGLLE